MNTPKAIIKAASGYIKDVPGSKIVYLGKYDESDAYFVKMPDKKKVGFPPVFLFKDSTVRPILGEDALFVISSLS